MSRRTLFILVPGTTQEVALSVQQTTTLGTCLDACIQRFQLARVDAYNRSLLYHLCPVSGGQPFPLERTVADLGLPDGSHLMLVVRCAATEDVFTAFPRRSMLAAGSALAICALTGFCAGVTTALAQHVIAMPVMRAAAPSSAVTPPPSPPSGRLTASSVLGEHQQVVRSVAWSPDQGSLAIASERHVFL